MNTITYDQELDCRGLNCPLPILKTNQTISKMDVGQILKVEASDPGSVSDMLAWSKQTENELITHHVNGELYTYYIKKS
ncbi:MAG: sulfurtransferase TusA family protein [Candidatus Marinimicrobia bacterium]|nr:sulfurtransferase TusA family protein [Candidatus Neomarinimicrobiota bacterium]